MCVCLCLLTEGAFCLLWAGPGADVDLRLLITRRVSWSNSGVANFFLKGLPVNVSRVIPFLLQTPFSAGVAFESGRDTMDNL